MSPISACGVSVLRLTALLAAADSERCPAPSEGVALTLTGRGRSASRNPKPATRHKRDRGSPGPSGPPRRDGRSLRPTTSGTPWIKLPVADGQAEPADTADRPRHSATARDSAPAARPAADPGRSVGLTLPSVDLTLPSSGRQSFFGLLGEGRCESGLQLPTLGSRHCLLMGGRTRSPVPGQPAPCDWSSVLWTITAAVHAGRLSAPDRLP